MNLEGTASEDGCARKVSHLVGWLVGWVIGLSSRILMNPRLVMEVLITSSVLW